MNAKKRSSLPQLQQLLNKCEFHLIFLSITAIIYATPMQRKAYLCIYLSRSNNEMNMKENLTLPQSHVHVQQKKVLLDLNLSNSKTKAKGRSSLTQSKQQQRYRKCTFFHHNEIQLNLLANFLAVCDTMLSSNKKYIALILSVIRVLLTIFISLKCNHTFHLQLWPFAMLFQIISSSSTQCSNLCPQWCILILFTSTVYRQRMLAWTTSI